MSFTLVRIAFVYLILGVAVSAYSEYAVDFTLERLQINMLLLGWATTAILGLIVDRYPRLAQAKLTRLSIWLFVISIAVTLILLWAYLLGNPALGPFVVFGYLVVLVAVILLMIAMYRTPR
jgi:hypothetical protein